MLPLQCRNVHAVDAMQANASAQIADELLL